MTILVDTNVLARIAQPGHAHHVIALAASDRLILDGHDLRVVPQCLYEFYVVATRPIANNGLGMSAFAALREMDRIKQGYPLLPDSPLVLPAWTRLVFTHRFIGKSAHDARLVAAMEVHAVDAILTFNTADFVRYAHITVLDPTVVAATP